VLLLLLSRLVALFIPATGRRRSGERRPMPAEGMGLWRGSPWQPDVSLPPSPPLPRSPYAREAAADHRVDVTGVPLTRPYFRAEEKRQFQGERRLALKGGDCGPSGITVECDRRMGRR
jgi:hypothetical protein